MLPSLIATLFEQIAKQDFDEARYVAESIVSELEDKPSIDKTELLDALHTAQQTIDEQFEDL